MAPPLTYDWCLLCCQIINSDYQRLEMILMIKRNVSVSDEWTTEPSPRRRTLGKVDASLFSPLKL